MKPEDVKQNQSKEYYEDILESMRWHADTVVINDFNELVWLKPLYLNGKRIGITDCCSAFDPCPRHKEFNFIPEVSEDP